MCTAFVFVAGSAITANASAAGRCWSDGAHKAAKVRDLQTKLMVSALQCQARSPDVLAAYNRFVVQHRATISGHNESIRKHFVSAEGRAGERSYDRFTTALANVHGRTTSTLDDCDASAAFIRAAVNAPSADLHLLAESVGIDPALPGGSCPVQMAAMRQR